MPYLPVAVLVSLVVPGCAVTGPAPESTAVHLQRSGSGEWTVQFELSVETGQLGFARNPPVSRAERWTAVDADFEIVRIDDEDLVRRRDGRPFDRVEIQLTPTYLYLGKDYAPFSSFSDGGILVYTGRYFACPETCENKTPTWRFSLTDERANHILVGDKLHKARASWTDTEDGRNVYVGNQVPVETSHVWAMIDPAFPPLVVELLNTNLPVMADYFAARFGELPVKPVFFASYDPGHPSSSGRQGGTLPGQIFMHFFGDALQEQVDDAGFDLWLAWFFAHETAHLHQIASDAAESWIHEGAADAFAALALRDWSERAGEYVAKRKERARESCRQGLRERNLESMADQGDFQLYYHCGLMLHLALDGAMRERNPHLDGLFTLWSAYETEVAKKLKPDGPTFRQVVAAFLGADTANWVEAFTKMPAPDFSLPAYDAD